MGSVVPIPPELESSLREEVRQLKNAALSRHDIAIAQGMLMLRHGLDEQQAFAILSRRSKEEDAHVRSVAKDVTAEMRSLSWPKS